MTQLTTTDAEAAGVDCLDSAHSLSDKPLTAVDAIKKSHK